MKLWHFVICILEELNGLPHLKSGFSAHKIFSSNNKHQTFFLVNIVLNKQDNIFFL